MLIETLLRIIDQQQESSGMWQPQNRKDRSSTWADSTLTIFFCQ